MNWNELIAAVAVLVLGLLCWIFSALGLATMARRREVRGDWMGWLPVLNLILLGRLADDYLTDVKNIPSEKRKSLPILEVALLLTVAATVIFWILMGPMVSVIAPVYIEYAMLLACVLVAVIFFVQLYAACYHIFYSCTPDDAKLLTVLSVIFPVLPAFFLFALRKRENGMPLRRTHT